ncbi:MAG TPA: UDP-2,3-diacylglucosamine diphosphatase [Permianibacter sp.]|nr:UDP-2,3-diacylglucosamine diphosphatase [Permianibacter sp.]
MSDLHLGTKDCQAEALQAFLKSVRCDTLYLLGDIVDLWAMSKLSHWPQSHSDVVRAVLSKARRGTRVVYIPGNHDRPLRQHVQQIFGNIELHREGVHVSATGKRYWLIHGDDFDSHVRCNRLLELIGDKSNDWLVRLNRHVNRLRARLGLPYFSLAGYIKQRIGSARAYIERFENAVAEETARRGFDGVVCGHIHVPASKSLAGVAYRNNGDWVESCSALVEDDDGEIRLLFRPLPRQRSGQVEPFSLPPLADAA